MSFSSSKATGEIENLVQEFPELPYDRYKIFQHIGKGAFSRVYLAYTPEYKRRAIKRIRLTSKPHQIFREIQFLRMLEGKENVVQIKEIRFSMNTLQTSVITNFCDSDDFKAVIYTITPRDIQNYMRALLISLAHVERANMLHRDVKPGNFLFSKNTGDALLIDFGLAQTLREAREFPILRSRSRRRVPLGRPVMRDLRMTGFVNRELARLRPLAPQPHSGTHGYRAPEILVSVNSQDMRIDTWSAGVMMIQMLTGKTSLFRGNPTSDLYELTAIRSFLGTDRFTQGVGKLGGDFSLTAGVPMPKNISLEELTQQFNPDLFAVLPASAYDLCNKLLAFAPQDRPRASEALRHPFLMAPASEIPDFRYQNGAFSAPPPMPSRDINTHINELMRKAKGIAARAGLPQDTADNLAEEYVISVPATDLQALPKEHRRLVERALDRWKMTESQTSGPGPNVIRPSPSDYMIPSTCGLNNLSKTRGAVLANTQISAEPGFGIGPSAEPYVVEQEIMKESQRSGRQISQTEALERIWERMNREKEIWEASVRLTAVRRRLDPWVQMLKALDHELLHVQSEVRTAAEDYRLALVEQGHIKLEDPQEREAAMQSIIKMHERHGAPSKPMVAWLREGMNKIRRSKPSQSPSPEKGSTAPRNSRSTEDRELHDEGSFIQQGPSAHAAPLEEHDSSSATSSGAGMRFPRSCTDYDISVSKVLNNMMASHLENEETQALAKEVLRNAWDTATETAVERYRERRNFAIRNVRARNRALKALCTQQIALRGLEGNWRARTAVEFEERLRGHKRMGEFKGESAEKRPSTTPDSELWDESVTADDDSGHHSELQRENGLKTSASLFNENTTEAVLQNIQKHQKVIERRTKRRNVIRRAEAIHMHGELQALHPDIDCDANWSNFNAAEDVFEADVTDSTDGVQMVRPTVVRRAPSLLPQNAPHGLVESVAVLEVLKRRAFPHALSLFDSSGYDDPEECAAPNAPAAGSHTQPGLPDASLQALRRSLRAEAASLLQNQESKKRFIETITHPSSRFLIPFKQLVHGRIPSSLADSYPIGVQVAIKSGMDDATKKRISDAARRFNQTVEHYFASRAGQGDIVAALGIAQAALDKNALEALKNVEMGKVGAPARPPDLEQMLSLPPNSLVHVKPPSEGRSTSRSRPSRVLSDPGRVNQRYPFIGGFIQDFVEATLTHSTKLPAFVKGIEAAFSDAERHIQMRRLFLAVKRAWQRTSAEVDFLSSVQAASPAKKRALERAFLERRRRMNNLSVIIQALRRFGGEAVLEVMSAVASPGEVIVGGSVQRAAPLRSEAIPLAHAVAGQRAASMAPQFTPGSRKPWSLGIASSADIRAMLFAPRLDLPQSSGIPERVVGSCRLRREILLRSQFCRVRTALPRALGAAQ